MKPDTNHEEEKNPENNKDEEKNLDSIKNKEKNSDKERILPFIRDDIDEYHSHYKKVIKKDRSNCMPSLSI